MIIICSPTKTLSLTTPEPKTSPIFIEDAIKIMAELKKLSLTQLKALYKTSDKLTEQVSMYIQEWSDNARLSSIHAFTGLQFKNLDISTLDLIAQSYAYEHIKIASGLYGILNAQDGISPYRFDLENKIDAINVEKLYSTKINLYLQEQNIEILDLTSKEYSVLCNQCNPVKVIFLEDGKQKGTINKIYRGRLMRYCCINQIKNISKIKHFNEDGFLFDEIHSSNHEYIFTRRTK